MNGLHIILFIATLLFQVPCLDTLTLINSNRHLSMEDSENPTTSNLYLTQSSEFLISSMSYHESHAVYSTSRQQDNLTTVTYTQSRRFVFFPWRNILKEQANLLSHDIFLGSIYHIPLVKEDARHISTLVKGTIHHNHLNFVLSDSYPRMDNQ
jgi:hypothetical protein